MLVSSLSAPAYADSTCTSGDVCLWEDTSYVGDRYVYSGQKLEVDLGFWNGDNEISSVKNRSSYYMCLYDNDDYSGTRIRLSPGQYVAQLSDFDFDNEAESYKLKTSSQAC